MQRQAPGESAPIGIAAALPQRAFRFRPSRTPPGHLIKRSLTILAIVSILTSDMMAIRFTPWVIESESEHNIFSENKVDPRTAEATTGAKPIGQVTVLCPKITEKRSIFRNAQGDDSIIRSLCMSFSTAKRRGRPLAMICCTARSLFTQTRESTPGHRTLMATRIALLGQYVDRGVRLSHVE